jgi:inorganic phosphate transporter, PiT family
MLSTTVLLIVVVFMALVFDYINGFHDTANAIATVVSTRALTPRRAIIMAATLNFVGALYKTAVAKTIANDIVNAAVVNQEVVIGALIGAIAWNLLTWYYGIPSSSSHAIIGGVMGAAAIKAGLGALKWAGIKKVVLALVISPVLGAAIGIVIMYLFLVLFGNSQPSKVNKISLKLQIVTAGLLSFNHGSNDAQKSMGIITLALFSAGAISTPEVHLWVKLACALAMSVGTAAGGWRIIRTMGSRIFKIEPLYGCAAELSASTVIWAATELGLPVSTTHVVSGSIMGVGTAKRLSAVRWGIAQQMFIAWILTIPATALIGAVAYYLIHLLNI